MASRQAELSMVVRCWALYPMQYFSCWLINTSGLNSFGNWTAVSSLFCEYVTNWTKVKYFFLLCKASCFHPVYGREPPDEISFFNGLWGVFSCFNSIDNSKKYGFKNQWWPNLVSTVWIKQSFRCLTILDNLVNNNIGMNNSYANLFERSWNDTLMPIFSAIGLGKGQSWAEFVFFVFSRQLMICL